MFGKKISCFFVAGLVVAAVAGGASHAAEDNAVQCRLVRFVALPFTADYPNGAVVPIPFEGQPQRMLVDTGSPLTMLSEAAAERLDLKLHTAKMNSVIGIGAWQSNHFVRPDVVKIGRAEIRGHIFMVLPENFSGDRLDGLLGYDYLSVFDVDFDFAKGVMSLFSQKHENCGEGVVYWTNAPPAVIDFKLDSDKHIQLDVELDGKPVRAILDTGAANTTMSLETAADVLGMDADALRKAVKVKQSPAIRALTFQGISVKNPSIDLIADEDSYILSGTYAPKLLIGFNVLRHLHFYISYKERKIYMTAAGAQ